MKWNQYALSFFCKKKTFPVEKGMDIGYYEKKGKQVWKGTEFKMDEKQQEKREARRKRRIRNQIISYTVLGAMVLLIAAGVILGVRAFTADKDRQQEAIESSQAAIDNILSSEEVIQTPEPSPEVVELTPEQKLDGIVDEGISVMPLEDKVAGLFIVTPEAITGVSTAVKAGEGTQKALTQYAVGGIVYFSKNIQSEEQIKEMLDNTQLYTKYPIFLAVDEEGGSVARVADAGIGPKVDSAKTIGETGGVPAAYQAGQTIGSTLKGLGFNLDFAPVADLANVENSIMADRSFGSDAQSVGEMAGSVVLGLKEQGVASCLKHFPGMGGTADDPHNGLSTIDRTEEQFRSEEFVAFQAGIDAGADMVMITTAAAPGITGDSEPCVFSEKLVTDILRREMGFDGVIITDALNMSSISDYYGAEEAAIMAIRAGCDMILMPEDFEAAYNGVLQAVRDGKISEERINDSLKRIYRIKYADKYGGQIEQ